MMKTILPSSVGLEAVTPPVLNDTAPSNPNASLRAPASTVNINDLKVPAKELVTEIEETAAQFDLDATHIQSSPYADPLNHLDLGGLDQSLRLFAFALTQFQAKRPDYATADYMSTFNFSEIFSTLRDQCAQAGIEWKRQDFYVVIFRSKLRLEADRARLGELDQMSHQEACASGGLLQYWFGSPDSERRNLATCIWRNREDAAAGGRGPWHRKARGAAREMYETISFHTHKLIVEDGALSWRLEEYHD